MLKYREIIFASHNRGKIAEIREMLNPYGIKVLSAADLELPDVEETGKTFEENAYIKALAAAKAHNIPCFADDSGLCVDAIGGRPGVYTARYAPKAPAPGRSAAPAGSWTSWRAPPCPRAVRRSSV